ncbi:DUF4433 domain-containing protein [Methanovulcanius yangii]|uniref:DUF4433 domain-containing protein n=1 Tax=Methanovulcanius yangii TaxID=1789227 RepID=UPI0029CA0A00|nr:DUF4433 domain-containing protein [Methanovulcanius yangii]
MKLKAEPTGLGWRMRFSDDDNPTIAFQVSIKDLISLYLGLEKDAYVHDTKIGPIGHISINTDSDCYETVFNGKEISQSTGDVISAIPNNLFFQLLFQEDLGYLEQNQIASAGLAIQKRYEGEIQANKEKGNPDILKKHDVRALWHFCHIDNIPTILKYGIIARDYQKYCKIGPQPLSFEEISDPTIQKTRKEKGCHRYVPLYFANAAPMVYRIQKADNEKGLQDIVALEIDPEILFVNHKKITRMNAGCKDNLDFSSDLNSLSSFQWDLIHLEPNVAWNCEKELNHFRGAEGLIKYIIPPSFIKGIHVHYDSVKTRVREMVDPDKSIRVKKSLEKGGVNTHDLFDKE